MVPGLSEMERVWVAVTFAEAGEAEMAREWLAQGEETAERDEQASAS